MKKLCLFRLPLFALATLSLHGAVGALANKSAHAGNHGLTNPKKESNRRHSPTPRTNTIKSAAVTYLNQKNNNNPLITEAYAKVGNTVLHYVMAGGNPITPAKTRMTKDKLIIFYHGFPSFCYMWRHQITALAKHHRVVTVDGLGANLSDRPSKPGAYKISKLADELNQLAQQLAGDEPFILVGHDWGGALAWAFAPRDWKSLLS